MKPFSMLVLCAGLACAQLPNPTQRVPQTENPANPQNESMPVYRVTVVQRTTTAVSYRHRSGWTRVDLQGTNLAPEATGHADVNSRKGYIEVKASMHHLQPAGRYGPEYLTYVMWAITPEGRATNLGEVLIGDGDDDKIDVTTELQAFALIVTAEPYFAVTTPSDVVVMENAIRGDTLGKMEPVNVKYELLQRGQYTLNVSPGNVRPMVMDKKIPLELYEARNALQVDRWTGADKYASDTYQQAQQLLDQAQAYLDRKAGMKPVQMTAREAVQKAEDARIIAIRKQDEERLAQERQAAADREAKAKAETQAAEAQKRAEIERRQLADQARLQAETERLQAEKAKAEAQAAAQQAASERAAADRARAEADAARQQAEAARQQALQQEQAAQEQASQAKLQAEEADRLRQKAESDREALRQQLLQQLNMVLETRETARGLIVNMSDVLFDTGRYTLKPGAREKLAKIAGIVIAHPGLTLAVEGHTDSTGSLQLNQRLSEQRANSVRDYLISQGLNANTITAQGFGPSQPVASNATAAGRQQNRRVEMVVAGDVIGTSIQSLKMNTATPQQQPQR